jgi:tripartite-type tricarboxylate transporter receptor subunit TctC
MTVLASVNSGRLAASPDVPSTGELFDISIPGLVIVMGPKGIPADKVEILEGALKRATGDKAFAKLLTENLKFPQLFKTGAEVKAQIPKVTKQLKDAREKMGL